MLQNQVRRSHQSQNHEIKPETISILHFVGEMLREDGLYQDRAAIQTKTASTGVTNPIVKTRHLACTLLPDEVAEKTAAKFLGAR